MLLKTKKQIIEWLENYGVKNYKLIPDEKYGYLVNVNGPVYLSHKQLESIYVKFNIIKGHFDCGINKLLSLEYGPKVVNGSFFCNNNKLTSLKHLPKISKHINCSYNELTSFDYCPNIINGSFSCKNNKIKSLIGCAEIVSGDFDVQVNELDSLEHCPKIIGNDFLCNNNKLTSLKYSPKIINGWFDCSFNLLQDLEYCPEKIKMNCIVNNNLIKTLKHHPKTVFGNFIFHNNNIDLIKKYDINENITYEKLKIFIEKEKLNLLISNKDKLVENDGIVKSLGVEKIIKI